MKMAESKITSRSKLTSQTKKINIEIKDFGKEIIGEKKGKGIHSHFNVNGVKFSIEVRPEAKPDQIGFYVQNQSGEVQATSIELLMKGSLSDIFHFSSTFNWSRKELKSGLGWDAILSHKDYLSWASKNGDVLKLEVDLTLHIKDKSDVQIPVSPSQKHSTGKLIMEDLTTTDLTIRCNAKTFRVHRNFTSKQRYTVIKK